MKQLLIAVTLLLCASAASAQRETPATFAARVAAAFESKNLGTLDAARPMSVKVTIEHSLLEGKGSHESRTFRSLKSAQVWLRKKMIPEAAFQSGKLDGCGRGRCEFTQNGMLHNHLYLASFTYGTTRGKLYLKSLSMIDGD